MALFIDGKQVLGSLVVEGDLTTRLPTYKTSSGSIATFETDMTENLISCVAKIMATQSGSGTPSPSNPRPISGVSAVNLSLFEVNLWNEDWEVGMYNVADGSKTSASTVIRNKTPIAVKGNFYLSMTGSGNAMQIYKYDKNMSYLGYISYGGSGVKTIDNDVAFINFNLNANYGTTYNHDISINYPSTDTSYHSFVGGNYTCSFGQTVYGGEIDVTTGVITLTHIGVYLTGSCIEANWYNADIDRNSIGFYIYPNPYVNNTGYPFPIEAGGVFDYCQTGNVYNNDNAWTANFLFVGGEPNRFEIRLPKSVLSDISSDTNAINSAKDYLNNNPLQTVYKITPTTIQANALQIPTINGTNNLFADTGDISAKYILSVGEALRQAV